MNIRVVYFSSGFAEPCTDAHLDGPHRHFRTGEQRYTLTFRHRNCSTVAYLTALQYEDLSNGHTCVLDKYHVFGD